MISHSVPENNKMDYFYCCKATEWGGGEEAEQVEIKSKLTRSWTCLK